MAAVREFYHTRRFMTGKIREKNILLAGCFLAILLLLSGMVSVRGDAEAKKYTVTFVNPAGKSNRDYRALALEVADGEKITFPKVPVSEGYAAWGWSLERKAKSPSYAEGMTIGIHEDTEFYAVWKKLPSYQITFHNNSGTEEGDAYKALDRTVYRNKKLRFPKVPEEEGFEGLGWSTRKSAETAEYLPGDKLKISRDMVFYAVQKKKITVVLHQNSGEIWQSIVLEKGADYILPEMENPPGYTMLGWSETAGKDSNPDYEPGESLKDLDESIELYAVLFDRNTEEDLTAEELLQSSENSYGQVIFVGDSRFNRMEKVLENLGEEKLTENMKFISQNGAGLSWLKEEGYQELLNSLGDASQTILNKKTAVIFNLGVNELEIPYQFVMYMRSIAPDLEKRNCELFYMSVNPVNFEMIVRLGQNVPRTEAAVQKFNEVIQSGLCTGEDCQYRYLDACSFLVREGYSTDVNKNGTDTGVDDGLHYTSRTSKRIFRYCMEEISRG